MIQRRVSSHRAPGRYARQRPRLELPNRAALHRTIQMSCRSGPKMLWPDARGKDDAEAEGVHEPGDAVLPCHVVERLEQRVAVVERVNDGPGASVRRPPRREPPRPSRSKIKGSETEPASSLAAAVEAAPATILPGARRLPSRALADALRGVLSSLRRRFAEAARRRFRLLRLLVPERRGGVLGESPRRRAVHARAPEPKRPAEARRPSRAPCGARRSPPRARPRRRRGAGRTWSGTASSPSRRRSGRDFASAPV